MASPNLIHINGPPGIGKSTIARRYLADHPLALSVDTDQIIASMGQWQEREDEARERTFVIAKAMAEAHLLAGFDVVLPFLSCDTEESVALEGIARATGSRFFEFNLVVPKEEATARMLARGTWGEPDTPPVTEEDIPIIHDLYDKCQNAAAQRPSCVDIIPVVNDVDATYQQLVDRMGLDASEPLA